LVVFIKYGAVILSAILLGRWFDQERTKLLKNGAPWHKAWKTLPGILILVILAILIVILIMYG